MEALVGTMNWSLLPVPHFWLFQAEGQNVSSGSLITSMARSCFEHGVDVSVAGLAASRTAHSVTDDSNVSWNVPHFTAHYAAWHPGQQQSSVGDSGRFSQVQSSLSNHKETISTGKNGITVYPHREHVHRKQWPHCLSPQRTSPQETVTPLSNPTENLSTGNSDPTV